MTEFEKFAIKDQGIGSNTIHSYGTFMSQLPMVIGPISGNHYLKEL